MDSNRSTVINCYGETEIIDNENEARSGKRKNGKLHESLSLLQLTAGCLFSLVLFTLHRPCCIKKLYG